MAGRVLEGLRILDLTRVVAGPFATAVLADLGADIVKVERPKTGDDYRYGPSPKGETSLSFQNTNRGKRSITLDLRLPEGRELFLRLVDGADAVVENFRAGWLADFVGGLYLGLGVVAALLERNQTGTARVLDLSNQDTIFAVTDSMASVYATLGHVDERVGNQHPFTAPYDSLETKDGFVVVACGSNKLFRALAAGIGRPELADDERYRTHRVRAAHRVELNGIFADWARERTCDEVIAALGPEGADVPVARVASPSELLTDPQLLAREMVERHSHPSLGEVVFHGNPLRFDDTEARQRPLAPDLGEHNAELYAELGLDADTLASLAEKGVI